MTENSVKGGQYPPQHVLEVKRDVNNQIKTFLNCTILHNWRLHARSQSILIKKLAFKTFHFPGFIRTYRVISWKKNLEPPSSPPPPPCDKDVTTSVSVDSVESPLASTAAGSVTLGADSSVSASVVVS